MSPVSAISMLALLIAKRSYMQTDDFRHSSGGDNDLEFVRSADDGPLAVVRPAVARGTPRPLRRAPVPGGSLAGNRC